MSSTYKSYFLHIFFPYLKIKYFFEKPTTAVVAYIQVEIHVVMDGCFLSEESRLLRLRNACTILNMNRFEETE